MQPVKTAGQIRFYAAPSVQYIPPPPTHTYYYSTEPCENNEITGPRRVLDCWMASLGWEKGERGGRERDSQFQTQFRVRQPLPRY